MTKQWRHFRKAAFPFYGWIGLLETWQGENNVTIWWNIKINLQKLVDIRGYEFPTNSLNFTQKDLTEVKIFQKILGGLFLKHPVDKLLHPKESRRCFCQAARSIIGLMWPWPLTHDPKVNPVKSLTHGPLNLHQNWFIHSFLSASLYVSKRGAYWDRLCRDIVGRWLSRACTVAKRCILGL